MDADGSGAIDADELGAAFKVTERPAKCVMLHMEVEAPLANQSASSGLS